MFFHSDNSQSFLSDDLAMSYKESQQLSYLPDSACSGPTEKKTVLIPIKIQPVLVPPC